MSTYRDSAADPIGRIEEKLDRLLGDVDKARQENRKPRFREEDAFWLALWPRLAGSIAVLIFAVFLPAYSCNHDDNRSKVEIARYQAETAARAPAKPSADAGAP